MATVRKRGSNWHVQIRRAGHPSLTRTFRNKASAARWARQTETKIDQKGLVPSRSQLTGITVGQILERYLLEVVPKKRSRHVEGDIIRALLRHDLAKLSLLHADSHVFAAFRDERLAEVRPATVLRQLGVIQHAFNVAMAEWDIPIQQNPVSVIRKPRNSPARDRRLRPGELRRLLDGCDGSRVWWLGPIITVAVETAMRRGEILAIQWSHLDLIKRTLHIPTSKNGYARTIPVTQSAAEIFSELPETNRVVFPVSGNAVRLAWQRLKRRVGIEGLRFHDLRHEGISRFFEMGLSVPEVALISGHRDYRMLARYTHLRAEDVAAKLPGNCGTKDSVCGETDL